MPSGLRHQPWIAPVAAAAAATAATLALARIHTPGPVVGPLDVDGWGWAVQPILSGNDWWRVLSTPSLFRGPVVSTLFGLVVALAPHPYAVLVLNAILLGCAAAAHVVMARRLGVSAGAAVAGASLWVAVPAHGYIHGHYYSEAVVSALLALMLLLVSTREHGWVRPCAAGAIAGVLILSRAPMIAVVGACGLYLLRRHWRHGAAFVFGVLLTYTWWPVYTARTTGQLIPFTTEGGAVMFQGTWLPGDDLNQSVLRRDERFRLIEEEVESLPLLERHKEWTRRAIDQVRANPGAQVRLVVKKAVRFWLYLQPYSWTPTGKSLLFALLLAGGIASALASGAARAYADWVCLVVLPLWAFYALIHTELRYQFPVLPMLLILAASGYGHLSRRLVAAPLTLTPSVG